MRSIRLCILVAIAAGTLADEADACTCIGPFPACQMVWETSAVFSGEAVDITPVQNQHGSRYAPERRVRFRVEQMWRGTPANEAVVMTGSGSGDCGIDFKLGERYVVYATARGEAYKR